MESRLLNCRATNRIGTSLSNSLQTKWPHPQKRRKKANMSPLDDFLSLKLKKGVKHVLRLTLVSRRLLTGSCSQSGADPAQSILALCVVRHTLLTAREPVSPFSINPPSPKISSPRGFLEVVLFQKFKLVIPSLYIPVPDLSFERGLHATKAHHHSILFSTARDSC